LPLDRAENFSTHIFEMRSAGSKKAKFLPQTTIVEGKLLQESASLSTNFALLQNDVFLFYRAHKQVNFFMMIGEREFDKKGLEWQGLSNIPNLMEKVQSK
jgi:hypothetical protein